MMNKTKYYQMQIYNDEQIWFDYLIVSILLDNDNGHLSEYCRLICKSSLDHRANRLYCPGVVVYMLSTYGWQIPFAITWLLANTS